jgi:hypothetical protein
MVEEIKNDREDDFINLLLEQALTRQRDEMMENFSHILQHLSMASSASSSNNHFGGTSPFKVHVNFYIPIFEVQSICPRQMVKFVRRLFLYSQFFQQRKYHLRSP